MSDLLPRSSRIWRAEMPRGPVIAAGDVLTDQFDKGVALVGYGLLIFSVFAAGLPALGALALATAHGRDSHLVVRTHYRCQTRIFWTGVTSFVFGILCALAAAAFALSRFWIWLTVQVPWLAETLDQRVPPGDRLQVAGWLTAGAILLIIYCAAHTLICSVSGAMKLVRGRPIGHIDRV